MTIKPQRVSFKTIVIIIVFPMWQNFCKKLCVPSGGSLHFVETTVSESCSIFEFDNSTVLFWDNDSKSLPFLLDAVKGILFNKSLHVDDAVCKVWLCDTWWGMDLCFLIKHLTFSAQYENSVPIFKHKNLDNQCSKYFRHKILHTSC